MEAEVPIVVEEAAGVDMGTRRRRQSDQGEDDKSPAMDERGR